MTMYELEFHTKEKHNLDDLPKTRGGPGIKGKVDLGQLLESKRSLSI